MLKKFFRIVNDSRIVDRWYLDEPILEEKEFDIWDLTEGKSISYQGNLRIPIQYEGPPIDFTFAAFDIPVVRKEVGELIQEIDNKSIQRLPVLIDTFSNQYELLIITRAINCIDEKKSKLIRWKETDGRPDKTGQIRMITELFVNASLIDQNCHIFRIKGWEVAILISEKLKHKMEKERLTGIQFIEV